MKSRISIFPNLWLSGIVLILMLALHSITDAQQTNQNPLDMQISAADELFLNGKYAESITEYIKIIQSPDLPIEFRSLFLLRIAYAQQAWGKIADCKKTLTELKAMDYLPEYHRLIISELETELSGKTNPSLMPTPKPSFNKIAAAIYVSSEGTGTEGTRTNPCPDIESALKCVREIRKQSNLEGAIEIALLDSVYNLQSSIVLDKEDSGTKRNPLLIRPAASGKHITFNGGCVISKWKTEDNQDILSRLPETSRGKVLVASLPENGVPAIPELVFGGFSSARSRGGNYRFGTMPLPELFYKGTAQTMARWPNESDTDIPLQGFTDDRPLRWVNESNLWLHGYWYWAWADAYEKVANISPDDKTINLEPPFNGYGFKDSKWHAVNALSEIDVPGEWHIDISQQKIHYLPPDNFDPEQCVLSAYGPIIQASECDFLAVSGINIIYVRGDGVIFENCSDLSITDCSIKAASGAGMRIRGGLRHTVHTVTIQHMGRGGIDISAGDWRELILSGDIIENCRISDLSRIDRTYTPALLLDGMGFKVRHCFFKDIPSSAIRMECSESLIELNEFFNCVSESDDQGAIDVWANPLYRGNVIRRNYFHDILGRHGMVAGIRLDDAISGFMISENVFIRSSGGRFGGVQIHGGKDSYVVGNIFVDCKTMVSNSPWGEKRWKESLTSRQGVILNHVQNIPWKTKEWLDRYPALNNLIDGLPDRNFLADNIAIDVETIHSRFSPNMVSINDKLIKTQAPKTLKDVKNIIVPWHPFPIDKIGAY